MMSFLKYVILLFLVLLPSSVASHNIHQYVIVDLSDQKIYLVVDKEVVWSRLVATGKDGFETPVGTYRIYKKLPLRTMRGSANGETWVVPNVPHVMYIKGGIALHGAYWHDLFGKARLSHGCINMRLADARWLYARVDVGTKVIVRG